MKPYCKDYSGVIIATRVGKMGKLRKNFEQGKVAPRLNDRS